MRRQQLIEDAALRLVLKVNTEDFLVLRVSKKGPIGS